MSESSGGCLSTPGTSMDRCEAWRVVLDTKSTRLDAEILCVSENRSDRSKYRYEHSYSGTSKRG